MNTRFFDSDGITQMLKTHRIQAKTLNQVLGNIQDLSLCVASRFLFDYAFSLPLVGTHSTLQPNAGGSWGDRLSPC